VRSSRCPEQIKREHQNKNRAELKKTPRQICFRDRRTQHQHPIEKEDWKREQVNHGMIT